MSKENVPPLPYHAVPPSVVYMRNLGVNIFESPLDATYTEQRINSIETVLTVLKDRLALDNPEIIAGPVTLARGGILNLIGRLSDSKIEEKMVKMTKRDPEWPLRGLIAGRLTLLFDFKVQGEAASNSAEIFLAQILDWSRKEQKVEKVDSTLENIITFDQLDTGMDLVEHAMVDFSGSVALQLTSSLSLPTHGVVALVKRDLDMPDERSLLAAKALVDVLRGLKDIRSAEVLYEWVTTKISNQTQECILFLTTLVQATTFLDDDTFTQLYAGEQDELDLLPFETLRDGIQKAIEEIDKAGGKEYIPQLESIKNQLLLRHKQISKATEKGRQVKFAITADAAFYEEVTLMWITDAEKLGLNNRQAAEFIVRHLEQFELPDIENFLATVEGLGYSLEPNGTNLLQELKTELARRGIVNNNGEVKKALMKETFELLQNNPFRDASEINFVKEGIITPDTHTLIVELITCTAGPFTQGHVGLVEKALAYIHHQEQFDKPGTKRIVLISPLTDPEVVGHKSVEKVGDLAERSASIMLSLAKFDRNEVFVTLDLAPSPSAARKVENSILTTVHNLDNHIMKSCGEIRQVTVVPELMIGSDEIKGNPSRSVISEQQPVKVRQGISVVVAARHGHILGLIENEEGLRKHTNTTAVILSPDTANLSSSKVRDQILAHNHHYISAATQSYYAQAWSDARREERKRGWAVENTVKPLSHFYKELMMQYKLFFV